MFFKQQLLHIIQKYDGQRTVFSAYHLLKGKKSGQTIQDVGLFDLHPYFNLMPKLTKEIYLEQIDFLLKNQLIVIDTQQMIAVTTKNEHAVSYFDGWHLRGGEHLFFMRLQLIVQTISNDLREENKFLPIIRDDQVQLFVRNYLKWIHFKKEHVQQQFINELMSGIDKMETTEEVKNLLVYRLTGYGTVGWTWQQLAEQLKIEVIDVQLAYIHGLHLFIQTIEKGAYPLLMPILQGVRLQTVLTESTQKTANLFKQGYSLEQIAHRRRLKVSTIEDHIAELAMIDPNFDSSSFLSESLKKEIKDVIRMNGSKKLKPIKEQIPQASYFQIRLVLAMMGGMQNA